MQPLTLKGAASTPGYALGVAEERKIAAHAEDCQAAGVHFIPLVMETVGGWGRDLIETVKSLWRLQAQRLGSEPAKATRHLAQKVSISLWRGNAALWTARQPSVPSVVDGLLWLPVCLIRYVLRYLKLIFACPTSYFFCLIFSLFVFVFLS